MSSRYLDYNLLGTDFDKERMREAVRKCIEIGEQSPYDDIIEELMAPTPVEAADDELLNTYMMKCVGTSHHVSGTCKMGPDSDDMAVLDQYGNVKGVENLKVADASNMPDCIRANTNVTCDGYWRTRRRFHSLKESETTNAATWRCRLRRRRRPWSDFP